MPKHRPTGKTRNGNTYKNSKPWRACVKVQGQEYFLGDFLTREEAVKVERNFRMDLFGSPEVRRKPLVNLIW